MRLLRRPEGAAGLLALVLGLLHLLLAPDAGTDLAAQLARADFARHHPLTPVDLSWYGGSHPFGYSVLAPWLMALLGVPLAGLLAEVGGAVLLARLLRGAARPLSGSLLSAVFLVADVVSGRVTFALGAVAGLACLVVLPRRVAAAVLAVLTALLSPVAAAFLGLAAAVLVLHRRVGGWTVGVATTVPVLLLAWLFPGGGVQPFNTPSAVRGALVCLVVAALSSVPVVRTGALLSAAAIGVFALHDDPFGSNALRLALLLAAPLLVATARRQVLLVTVAAAGVLWWQVGPTWGDLRAPAGPSYGGLVRELQAVGALRVEVLAPRDHRESYEVARSVPLARGWARQLDYAQNRLFYKGTLTAEAYLSWLREHAVDHVAVPVGTRLDFGSAREGALLGGPVAGLAQVWRSADWVLYAVADPVPLVSAPARVVAADRTSVTVRTDGPADVVLHVGWDSWLSVDGPACLARAGSAVRLAVREAATVTVSSALRPHGHC
jgi:8-oxo-dGTP pyrophosphatase MutT (NUDIX family)